MSFNIHHRAGDSERAAVLGVGFVRKVHQPWPHAGPAPRSLSAPEAGAPGWAPRRPPTLLVRLRNTAAAAGVSLLRELGYKRWRTSAAVNAGGLDIVRRGRGFITVNIQGFLLTMVGSAGRSYSGCFQPLQWASSCRATPGSSTRVMKHRPAALRAQPRRNIPVGGSLPTTARQRRSTSRKSPIGNTVSIRSDYRTNCAGGLRYFDVAAKRLGPVGRRKSGAPRRGHGGSDSPVTIAMDVS